MRKGKRSSGGPCSACVLKCLDRTSHPCGRQTTHPFETEHFPVYNRDDSLVLLDAGYLSSQAKQHMSTCLVIHFVGFLLAVTILSFVTQIWQATR